MSDQGAKSHRVSPAQLRPKLPTKTHNLELGFEKSKFCVLYNNIVIESSPSNSNTLPTGDVKNQKVDKPRTPDCGNIFQNKEIQRISNKVSKEHSTSERNEK